MKFARSLEATQIPEWKKAYIDFKGLKKRIAAIRNAERQGTSDIHIIGFQDPMRLTLQPSVDSILHEIHDDSKHADSFRLGLSGISSKNSSVLEEPHPGIKKPIKPPPVWIDLSRPSAKTNWKSDRRSSLSKIFAAATCQKPRRTSKQSYTTIESLYLSLNEMEANFFAHLDHELEKVDSFYIAQENSAITKFIALKDQLHEFQEHRLVFYAQAGRDEPWKLRWNLSGALGLPGGRLQPTQGSTQSNVGSAAVQSPPVAETSLNPYEYHRAKQKLKEAFREFYRSLELLNDYRVLNLTGFRKALKKFDKVTQRPSQDIYTSEKILPRRFASGDTMENIMREVEDIFATKFENGDLKKARGRLKSPFLHKSHYFSTFRSGIYLGVAIPALVHGIYTSFLPETHERLPQWDTLLELYGAVFIPVIFSLLIGVNILAWSRARINFPFIFEINVRTATDIREYFEVPAIMFVTLSSAFWLTFVGAGSQHIASTTWPAIWLGFAILFLMNPLPVLSRSSRLWIVKSLSKLLIAGTSHVVFTEFWLADQLCSLVFSMQNLYNIACAYSNEWSNLSGKCYSTNHWAMRFGLEAIPSFIRTVQSFRSYYESRHTSHLINAGKYSSSILAYLTYNSWRARGSPYDYTFVIWCMFAALSSMYTSSWDILMDWSFFRPRSQHLFLRRELIYTNSPWMYYFAIISNIFIRFIWVIHVPMANHDPRAREFIAAVFEMLRRFQWNFYRLENEQIGNADQYRATRDVPLPYLPYPAPSYDEEPVIELVRQPLVHASKAYSSEKLAIEMDGLWQKLSADMDAEVWEKV